VALHPLSLGQTGLKIEASTQCCKELSACYVAAVLRIFFSSRQYVQKCCCHNHVLAGPGKGGELPLRIINHRDLACLKRQFTSVQVSQSSLNDRLLVGKLPLSLHGFVFDVILLGTSSFLQVGCRSPRKRCWCSVPLWPC
jgi:hypothetical protein